jgi:phosphoglycerate dehydrogenase-like enzyme
MTTAPASLPRIALIDDSQGVALTCADWTRLRGRAEITVLPGPFADDNAAAAALEPFDVIVPMRERTPFSASLIARLPRLKLLAMTGERAGSFDMQAFTSNGTLVCNTVTTGSRAATAELAIGLMLATARALPRGDLAIRSGGWHQDVPLGDVLEGKRLGIVGLGRIGTRVARGGAAFGMEVAAWSEHLTPEAAALAGAVYLDKAALFQRCDVISVHLVLSSRTRGIIGAKELEAMKPGAILVNTARGQLVDQPAMRAALMAGRIRAGLDVFEHEPLLPDDPLRNLSNVVLTPHLGYVTTTAFHEFYGQSLENIEAWLDGKPRRMVNPDVLAGRQ